MNWKVLAVGAALTLPLVAVLAAGFGDTPQLQSDALTGTPAPNFTLETLDGQPLTLSDLKGKPAVLNFWSTWCQPCKVEHPHLIEAARRYRPRGVSFLGVVYQDDTANVQRFLATEGRSYPVLLDPSSRTAIDFGVTGVPETFFLDAEGNIVKKYAEPINLEMISAVLEPLL